MKLSVVIAAWNHISSLERCLASLKGQGEAEETELIVVSNYGEEAQKIIKTQFPDITYISLPENTTVPELRAEGIFHATGDIIALVEDHCIFDKHWCSEIKTAHELPYSIIGGAVENASCQSPLDWAVYFYDYGKYMLPNQAGVVDSLSGMNVSYKRSILEKMANQLQKGFKETFVHREFQKDGHPLYLMPSAIVYHQKTYKLKKALMECYHHGRSFGGMRVSNTTLLKRIVLLLGSLILPILLPSRIVLRTVQKGRHTRELSLSLPYLLLLMGSWAYGEFWGYVWGEGTSTAEWK